MRKILFLIAPLVVASWAMAQPALRLKNLHLDLRRTTEAGGAPPKTRNPGYSHLLLQFENDPSDLQLNELRRRGVAVLSYVPDFAFLVSAGDGVSLDGMGILSVGRLAPEEKISPGLGNALGGDATIWVLAEFYPDVGQNMARAIATEAGFLIRENPDLLPNHLLLSGTVQQVSALAQWDEVSYIFPAAWELISGTTARGCAGGLTNRGVAGQSVAAVGDGWDGPGRGGADLRYAWSHLTERLPAAATEAELVRALNEWAKYAKLTFTETTDGQANRTLAILFAGGDHGDGYPFDGPGGVLAHAFYPNPINPEPIAGDIHFDSDESWKIGAELDVFSVALHEAGHALGLGHSDRPGAVMYPYHHSVKGLTQEDIDAILELYAAQDGSPGTPAGPLELALSAPASPTSAPSIAVSGTTTGGSGAVLVTWSTNQGYAGAAQGSANWTIASIPLNIGDNTVTIVARDSQQNQVSRSFTITRLTSNPPPGNPPPGGDKTPPSLVILSPPTTNYSTSANSIVVRGTAQDNAGVVSVTWSSSNGNSGTASGTTDWATPPIPLYIGATTITIRVNDAAGNTGWRSMTITRF